MPLGTGWPRKDRKDRLADLGFYGFGMICLCFFKHCSAAGNFKSQFCINFDDRLFPHSRKVRLLIKKSVLSQAVVKKSTSKPWLQISDWPPKYQRNALRKQKSCLR